MNLFSKLGIVAVGISLGMAASPAQAAILSVSGNGEMIETPADTNANKTESSKIQGFDEKQNILLDTDLLVDGGTIAAGTEVSSHMLFLDPIKSNLTKVQNTKWLFDGVILGVMSDQAGSLEKASRELLGAENTAYQQNGSHGFESNDSNDNYSINGNELTVGMRATYPGDWIRVVTAANTQSVPEPASILGIFTVTGLGAASLKRKSAKAKETEKA